MMAVIIKVKVLMNFKGLEQDRIETQDVFIYNPRRRQGTLVRASGRPVLIKVPIASHVFSVLCFKRALWVL